jgi:hypothetical protein
MDEGALPVVQEQPTGVADENRNRTYFGFNRSKDILDGSFIGNIDVTSSVAVAGQASSRSNGTLFIDISGHNLKPSFRESAADLLPDPTCPACHKSHTIHDISSLWLVSRGP